MKKDKGYWENWSNVEKELNPICEKLNRFPSQTELNKMGLSFLGRKISMYYGGVKKVADKLGYPTYDESIGRKMMGYWTFEKTVESYVSFVRENGLIYYPTQQELIEGNQYDLVGSIAKFGGYNKFKDTLKEEYNFILSERPTETKWSLDAVKSELLSLYNKLGYIPSLNELDKLGRTDLRGAVDKRGGLKEIVKSLGVKTKSESLKIKESGYWMNINNVHKELKPIIEKIGHFPTYTELKIMERIDIIGGIKYYNGIENLARELGYELISNTHIKTKDGHLVRSVFEVLLDNFFFMNNIQHETEGVITEKEKAKYMYDFKVKNSHGNLVYFEIWGYRKKRNSSKIEKNYNEKREIKEQIYKDNNLILVSLEEELFNKDFKKIYNYLVEICKKYNIKNTGFNYNVDYIDLFLSNAYSVENLHDDLKPYIKEYGGYMPTPRFLRSENREDLVGRIQRFGGFPYLKNKFNLEEKPKKKKWDDDNLFLSELIPICKELDRMPTWKELLDMGRGDLLGAINKRGGVKIISKKIGFMNKQEYDKQTR